MRDTSTDSENGLIFTLTIPAIVLVWGATAIPADVRRLDLSVLSWDAGAYDVVANFIGYIPLGVVLANLKCWRAMTVAMFVSLVAELCQFFMRYRFPSPVDLALNVAGASAGILVSLRWQFAISKIKIGRCSAILTMSIAIGLVAFLGAKAWWHWRDSDWGSIAVNRRGAISPGQLEAHWTLDQAVNGMVLDASGNGLSGNLAQNAELVPGKHGPALQLDGSGQYVDFGTPVELRIVGSLTICAWIKSREFPRDDAAIVSTHLPGYQLDTTVDRFKRTIGFKLTDPCGNLMARYGSTELSREKWYHVAGVYDADSKLLHVYLDGDLDDGDLLGIVTNSQKADEQRVFVGRRADLEGYEFNGLIDDVRVFSRALTPDEIKIVMEGLKTTEIVDEQHPSILARQVLKARQSTTEDAYRRATELHDTFTPGIILSAGLLAAVATAGFWPTYRITCLAAGLAVGIILTPISSQILPAYDAWMILLLGFSGGAAAAVSRRAA